VAGSVGRTGVRVEVAVGDGVGVGGTGVRVGAGVPVWEGLAGARVAVSVLTASGVKPLQADKRGMARIRKTDFSTQFIWTSQKNEF